MFSGGFLALQTRGSIYNYKSPSSSFSGKIKGWASASLVPR